MEAFEKWFSDYKGTIMSLQKQKISSGRTKINQLTEELLKAEKIKGKTYQGRDKQSFISGLGINIRRQEEMIRKYERISKTISELDPKIQYSLLEKHSLFDSISTEDNFLNIYTKTLKYENRKIIGKYRFIVNNKDQSFIKVVNIMFDNTYGPHEHWAVNDHTPCLGDWHPDFVKVSNEGDLYGLLDFMVMYLQISGDRSVYQRIPDWFKNQDKCDKERSEKKKTIPASKIRQLLKGYDDDYDEDDEEDLF